jgi:hypothetical protein
LRGLVTLGLGHDGGDLFLCEVGGVNDKVSTQFANVAFENTLPDLGASLLRDLASTGVEGRIQE